MRLCTLSDGRSAIASELELGWVMIGQQGGGRGLDESSHLLY
jgi:hypothetical protein